MMKKYGLKNEIGGKDYFDSKIEHFENFYIFFDILILKELSESELILFQIKEDENIFTFLKRIKLEKEKPIGNICGNDRKHLFFTQLNEIYCLNFETQNLRRLNLTKRGENYNIEIGELYLTIHEFFSFPEYPSKILFGFIATQNKLYLTFYDKKQINLNLIEIQCPTGNEINIPIIDIQYYCTFKNTQSISYLIILFYKNSIYFKLIEIPLTSNLLNFCESFQKGNWDNLYKDLSPNSYYLYSCRFSNEFIYFYNNSIVICPQKQKLLVYYLNHNMKKEENDSNLFIEIEVPNKINQELNLIKMKKLIFNGGSIFLIYSNEFVKEFNITKEITKTIINKNLTGKILIKVDVFKVFKNSFLFFLFDNEIYGYPIKKVKKRYSSQIPSKIINMSLTTENIKEEDQKKNLHFEGEKKNEIFDFKRITLSLNQKFFCTTCNQKAYFKCNKCLIFYSCTNPTIHISEWENHCKKCKGMKIDKYSTSPHGTKLKSFIRSQSNHISQDPIRRSQKDMSSQTKTKIFPEEEMKLITYHPMCLDLRFEMISSMKNKKYEEAIIKSNLLLEKNVNQFLSLIEKKNILLFVSDEIYNYEHVINKFSPLEIENSFLFYEEYFINFLLCIHLYSLVKSQDKVRRLLYRLLNEMNYYNLSKIIELLSAQINPKNTKPSSIEKVYINVLKIYIAICKYSYALNEIYLFEKYLLCFVQKIQKVLSSNKVILYSTYLLLGNLYMSIGHLRKSHILYETINKNNLNNKESNLQEVLLSANYNSGIVYFLIGSIDLSRKRFETALQIKLTQLKEKSNIEISTIYETLAEVEVESKNYAQAYKYIRLAVETYETINESKNEDNFQTKLDILKEFIENCLLEENKNQGTLEPLNKSIQGITKSQFKIDDAEDEGLFKQFLGGDFHPEIQRNFDLIDLKTFYLFVGSLTDSQIKKLNFDQPKDLEANKKNPIIFTQEFKQTLNHKQRINFCRLNLSNITRLRVLKNYAKKIKIKNLNYNALYSQKSKYNLDKISVNYSTKKILKNWELDPDKLANDFFLQKEALSLINERLRFESEMKKKKIQKLKKDDIKISILERQKYKKIVEEIFEESEFVDFDKLETFLKKYCNEHGIEKVYLIDENFMGLIARELEKETLKKIVLNPELIVDILETYELEKNNQYINDIKKYNMENEEEEEEGEEEEEEEQIIAKFEDLDQISDKKNLNSNNGDLKVKNFNKN